MPARTIHSLQNPQVKAAVHLRRSRQRHKQSRILIEGARELGRALEAGVALQQLFVCGELCQSDESRRVLAHGESVAGEVLYVTPPIFEKLSFGERVEGLIAVAHVPSKTLWELKLPDVPLVAVLEAVEKPGNVGAVIRSAYAAGVDAMIAADAATDLFNPAAIRASLGTVFTLPVAAAGAAETIEFLRNKSLAIYAARPDAELSDAEADFTRPAAIVLGSEATGLSPTWRGEDVTAIRLPMREGADSLNVSATAAVLFYEARRQRSAAGV